MAAERTEKMTTPVVRISFPDVFKMRSYQGGKPSYGIRLMFAKNDKEQMAFLKKLSTAMEDCMKRQWPDEATRPRIPIVGHDKSPIKDGDKNSNGQGVPFIEKSPELAGHYFLSASKYNDGLIVVDRNREEILDTQAVYGGCWCKVNITAYARTRSDNKGISVGLNGVQKWKDDERLGNGGAPSLEDMFEADSGSNDSSNYKDDLPF